MTDSPFRHVLLVEWIARRQRDLRRVESGQRGPEVLILALRLRSDNSGAGTLARLHWAISASEPPPCMLAWASWSRREAAKMGAQGKKKL